MCLSRYCDYSAQAQTSETGEVTATSPGIKTFSINAAPVCHLGSKVNGGGSVSVNNLYLNGNVIYQLPDHFGTGISLFYNLSRFRFMGVHAIPLAQPWGTVQNCGVSVPFNFSLSPKWQVIVTPMAQYSGENGANWGSSIIYGGLGSVNYNWAKLIISTSVSPASTGSARPTSFHLLILTGILPTAGA